MQFDRQFSRRPAKGQGGRRSHLQTRCQGWQLVDFERRVQSSTQSSPCLYLGFVTYRLWGQLDAVLKSTINKDGDVGDKDGNSPFPGNINVLVFDAPAVRRTLLGSCAKFSCFFVCAVSASAGENARPNPRVCEPQICRPFCLVSFVCWKGRSLTGDTWSQDATKTVFKSATRLECMMQEFPRLLTGTKMVVPHSLSFFVPERGCKYRLRFNASRSHRV